MPSEFDDPAKARTPTTSAAARSMSATISAWPRARSDQPASVKIAKPELRWPQEPAFENVPTTSPDWRRGAVRSSSSRSFAAT